MNRKIVVKMGGSNLEAEDVLDQFAEAIGLVPPENDTVIVHGGGKDIGRQLDRMGRKFTFIDGLRVTDDDVIDVVEMVLSGLVNKWISRALGKMNIRAAGISGTDLGLFHAARLEVEGGDLGYVGTIESVNVELLELLLARHVVPVISPISIGPDYRAYNVNADHAAGKLAEAWKADDLIYITDVPGVTINGEIRADISIDEVEEMVDSGDITGGMIPKILNSAAAVKKGVGRVHIIGWKGRESIIESLDEKKHWGTVIY